MLTDGRLDTTGYAIAFPKPKSDSFFMCRGYAEFLTVYPRIHKEQMCDKVRLSFDGFVGTVQYNGESETKMISNAVVYMEDSPKVMTVIDRLEYFVGRLDKCDGHEELLASLEKLFKQVAIGYAV